MSSLEGQVAIVTGATSGIGAATAKAFVAAGARVVLSGRSERKARRVLAVIEAAGGEAVSYLGDVGKSGFAEELWGFAVETYGAVDVLANVAGTISRGDITQTTDEEWRKNMTTNVDAVFFTSRAAVRGWRATKRGGVIVNLASNVGLVGATELPAYCASKGAVVLLTKAMALDHAKEGIRVNALCPGAVDTPMLVSKHHKTGKTRRDVIEANIASIPQGRIPNAEEIAKSMLFLASDASNHITGVALPIDGGYVAQ